MYDIFVAPRVFQGGDFFLIYLAFNIIDNNIENAKKIYFVVIKSCTSL